MPFLFLSDEDVGAILHPDIALEAVRDAFRCHAAGRIDQPLKPYVRPLGREKERIGGRFIAMPAFVGEPIIAAGVKWIAGFPANVERGLPRASGLMVINCVETGRPLAVLECGTLSARRTAAVARLAIEHLGPTTRTIAIIGAGPIARSVIDSIRCDAGMARLIRVYDLDHSRLVRLVSGLADTNGCPVEAAETLEGCVGETSVVVTATTATRGYLCPEHMPECRLIVALSLEDCTPELFLGSDKVVVDDFDQACREEKLLHRLVQEGRFSREKIHAELGEIVTGRKPGRESDTERVYANMMGMAVEDIAVGHAVYRAALAQGIGQQVGGN